jgi:hypothetical protein
LAKDEFLLSLDTAESLARTEEGISNSREAEAMQRESQGEEEKAEPGFAIDEVYSGGRGEVHWTHGDQSGTWSATRTGVH